MSDGIVLSGLPGSGKTTVGRAVAARLGRPFIDIDNEVERISGCSSAELLARDGEPRLREVERTAVAVAVTTRDAVIATGGGTVIDPLNRYLLMAHGYRVRLDAPIDQLAVRLRADQTTQRPLLGGDLELGLARTAESRAIVYTATDAVIDATGEVDLIAAAVVAGSVSGEGGWRPLLDLPFERHHPMGPPTGRLLMGGGVDRSVLEGAADGRSVFVVDRRAISMMAGLDADAERTYQVDGGEQIKTMAELGRLLEWLADRQVERNDPLIVVGGGTVGDLGGLAAALHRRGIPLVDVPTTWLAQADSAIGGKVAVNLPQAKNGVGAIWPAWLIIEDSAVIETLPIDRRRDGIAECLKAGLIADPLLWQLIEERGKAALDGADPAAAYAMTERAVRVKLAIVDEDPFESGPRRRLNLGHTLGHALEIESRYTLAHGQAVALGLRAVARIGVQRGAQANLAERIDTVLADLGFAQRRAFSRAAVVEAMRGDKKRERGKLRWILPIDVGEVIEVSDVTDAELRAALEAIAA